MNLGLVALVPHDLSLHSGERQIAPTYADIRADHRFRYEWADAALPMGFGADIFCGNGYGAWLLAQRERLVLGIDGSGEAIAFADQHYKTERTLFSQAYWPFELPLAAFDFVTALESIEHVEDGAGFFRRLAQSLRPGGRMVFSTPCEDHLPLASTGNHFHHRHYTLKETLALGEQAGLRLVSWAGQDVYTFEDGRQAGHIPAEDMRLNERTPGQFTIVLVEKPERSWWRRG